MGNGWIKLHRQLLENPIAKKPAWLSLWITLLLKANHKEKRMAWNGKILVIKEGQLITGRDALAEQTGINRSSIERILNMLENEHQIEQQKTTKYRLITILNWDGYQGSDSKLSNKRATNEQQMSTNNNDKKNKNDKKDTAQGAEDSSKEKYNPLGAEVIRAFESVDPKNKGYYGNTSQRKACDFLVSEYGLDEVKKRIQVLPRTNKLPYFPTITTPVQLRDKWVQLQDAVERKRGEKISKIQKII